MYNLDNNPLTDIF